MKIEYEYEFDFNDRVTKSHFYDDTLIKNKSHFYDDTLIKNKSLLYVVKNTHDIKDVSWIGARTRSQTKLEAVVRPRLVLNGKCRKPSILHPVAFVGARHVRKQNQD
jgi:hypothetical protein